MDWIQTTSSGESLVVASAEKLIIEDLMFEHSGAYHCQSRDSVVTSDQVQDKLKMLLRFSAYDNNIFAKSCLQQFLSKSFARHLYNV